jgi:hypothetical protein
MRKSLEELAAARPRFGYPRLRVLQPLVRRTSSWIRQSSTAWAVGLLITSLSLVVGSEPRRVGDGGDYLAMTWQLAHFRHPALSAEDLHRVRAEFQSQADRTKDFAGWSPRHWPQLVAGDGREDLPHFWGYSLAAVPFFWLAKLLGQPDVRAFLLLNLVALALTSRLLARRCGAAIMLIMLASPVLWWVDKSHTELVLFCLLAWALALRDDMPAASFVLVALAGSQNLGLSVLAPLWALSLAVRHGRRLLQRRRILGLAAGMAVLAVHPVYYLLRLGVLDPQILCGTATTSIPTLADFITPVADPIIGLWVWWPVMVALAVCGLGTWVRSLIDQRSRREWLLIATDLSLVGAVLFAASQTASPDSGGTFSMSRYALWVAPFALPPLSRIDWLRRPRSWAGGVAVGLVAAGSVALSIHVARPSRPDVFFDPRPTWIAELVYEHAPGLYNPPPQVYKSRYARRFGRLPVAAANAACTKLLAVRGAWPQQCPPPAPVPQDCAGALYCYANRSGRTYSYVGLESGG